MAILDLSLFSLSAEKERGVEQMGNADFVWVFPQDLWIEQKETHWDVYIQKDDS